MGAPEVSFQGHVGDFLSARPTTSLLGGLLQEGGHAWGGVAVGNGTESLRTGLWHLTVRLAQSR